MNAVDGSSAILRVTAGTIFLFSGLQKLVPGIESTVGWFRDLGLPWPELLAPAVAGLEAGGGALLLVGLLTRLTACLFVLEMAVALTVDRLPAATRMLSLADAIAAVRVEALLAAACGCVALLGAGRLSVDSVARQVRPGMPRGDRA